MEQPRQRATGANEVYRVSEAADRQGTAERPTGCEAGGNLLKKIFYDRVFDWYQRI